jgi:hypothetical protein
MAATDPQNMLSIKQHQESAIPHPACDREADPWHRRFN